LCKCVPIILESIKQQFPPYYIINLQDWETALVVETMASYNDLLPHKCVITIHNPYDLDLPDDPEGRTILQYTLPKMAGISTVSEQYAYELTNDILQSKCLASKLQSAFQLIKPIGISNGNFIELSISNKINDPSEILFFKNKNREIFTQLLFSKEEIKPTWGKKIDLTKKDLPIFLLFGRDEPNQKGFDLAATTIYRLLKRCGSKIGYFIFTPIPGIYGLNNLAYFEDLCAEFGDNVMVFSNRLSIGYSELQRAANYIIMPSYYEPFGAANEGYAAGCAVIARATGGLIQQVIPLNFSDLPLEVQNQVRKYHDNQLHEPTGFLYREHPSTDTVENWYHLLNTNYNIRRSIQEPVHRLNPVFWSMSTELEKVIEAASNLYYENKNLYCQLILNGIKLFKKFSWENSAYKYIKELYKIEKEN